MNADPDAQLRLLDLQSLDSRLDQLAHRRRTLPELAALDALAVRTAAERDDLIRAETEVSDLDREQRRVEVDVDQVRARLERDQQRLTAGAASAKELGSLQSEVVSLTRRRDTLEDQVLEVMERRETADAAVSAISERLAVADAERAELEQRRDAAFAEIDAELADSRAQREPLVGQLPGELVTLYEKLRASHDGVGAAALLRGRCQGCHLSLSGSDLARLRAAPPDQVLRCEECMRILVRTPESGL